MRTFKHIVPALGAIICSLILVSCQKDPSGVSSQVKQIGDKLYWFTPAVEEDLTKAYANMGNSSSQGNCPATWEDGDEVFVLNGHDALKFRYNAANHKFVSEGGPNTSTPGMGITWKEKCGYVVVYPASIFVSQVYSTGTNLAVNVNLPSVQTFKNNSTCNKPPMMANSTAAQMENPYTTGTTVTFRNLCGVLGFSISGDNDKGKYSSISFTGKGACGAGSFTAHPTNEPLLTMSTASTNQTVTMDLDLSHAEGTTTTYYMYLPPATYSTATVAVNFAGGSTVDRTASGLLIERSKYASAAEYFQTLFSGGGELDAATGTAANPYLIRNGNDLIELAAKVNQTNAVYPSAAASSESSDEQAPGVTLSKSGVSFDTSGKYFKVVADIDMTAYNSNFAPIGTDANPFRGTLLGNSKTISGLSVSGASESRGLFGVINGATVSNLTISSPSVTGGTNYIGALAGKALSSTISSCTVTGGTISGSGNTIGGLVGLLEGGSVTSCAVTGGTVSCSGNTVGGLVGHFNGGTISTCSSTCAVNGASYVGGLIGAAAAGSVTGSNHTAGAVTGTGSKVGGFAGTISTTSGGASSATFTDCYAGSNVTCNPGSGNYAYLGGFVGQINGSGTRMTNCYTSGSYTVSSNGQVVGGIAGEVAGGAAIQGTSNGSRASNTLTVSAQSYVGGITGNVYNGSVKWYNNSGGTVTGSGERVSGIAGCIGNGAASSVTYCTNSRAVTGTGNNVGGVTGYANNGTVSNCTNSGTVTGAANIGGVAGYMATATVSSCSNSGTISTSNADANIATYLGGCVGRAGGTGTVSSCSNTMNISTVGRVVGGIVGGVTGATDITSCTHANNVVSTGYFVGGIVGYVHITAGGAGIRDCYANGITVKSTSDISGVCGGIAGHYYSPSNASGDITDVIYHCQAKECTIQATTAMVEGGWKTSRLGGIAGEIQNASRIIECASKWNKIYGRACCGGIVGMIQTKDGLSVVNHVLVRGCLSRSNWLYATKTDEFNYLGGIAGDISQATLETGTQYVRISECISDCNCYESKATSGDYYCSSGGIVGGVTGAAANVAIRNSFAMHHATVEGNKKGAGTQCFYLSRKAATGKAGAGGLVGAFTSGSGGILRIYNCGSRVTYGCWYIGGQTFETSAKVTEIHKTANFRDFSDLKIGFLQ